MKYFIAICTCIILLCSLGNTNKDRLIWEKQTEAIASISNFSDDTRTYRPSTIEKRCDAPNVKLSEQNNLCFSLRTPIVSKASKYFAGIKMPCNHRAPLPEEKFKCLYPSINYVKSTCRYFIYTLGHILI